MEHGNGGINVGGVHGQVDLGVVEGGGCGGGGAVDVVGLFGVKAADGETNYGEGSVSCLRWMNGWGSVSGSRTPVVDTVVG